MAGGIVVGIAPGGLPKPIRTTMDGALVTDTTADSSIEALLKELILEVRMLRLGLIIAKDSICDDIEGELTATTVSQE